MDLRSIVSEVQGWPPEERLRLIEEVWDGLSEETDQPVLTDSLQDLLDRRLKALDAARDQVMAWDEIKAYVRRNPSSWQSRG